MKSENKIERNMQQIILDMKNSDDLHHIWKDFDLLINLHSKLKLDENNFHVIVSKAMQEEATIGQYEEKFKMFDEEINRYIRNADALLKQQSNYSDVNVRAKFKGLMNSLYGVIDQQKKLGEQIAAYIKKLITDLEKMEQIEG